MSKREFREVVTDLSAEHSPARALQTRFDITLIHRIQTHEPANMAEPSFLGIPRELRDQIYGFLLPSDAIIRTKQTKIRNAMSSEIRWAHDLSSAFRPALVETPQGFIEAKAVYVDENMEKALATCCPTNIYGVSKQICSEVQDVLIRANKIRLRPADLKTPMRPTLLTLPDVKIWWAKTAEEVCDAISFLVDHREHGMREVCLFMDMAPNEYVKLDLESTRLLFAPLFGLDYKIE